MAGRNDIKAGLQVLGSDGGMVGSVDGVDGDRIKLKRAAELGGGQHHYIPMDWVERVDDHVHLSVDAATVRDRWDGEGAAAGGAGGVAGAAGYAGAPRTDDEGRTNWLPWLIGAALVALILFLGLRGCDYAATDATYNDTATGDAAGAGMAAGTFNRDVDAYYAGSEVAPRTFAFQNLEFDTSSAEVRPDYAAEIDGLARTLNANTASRVRIVGYADARGAAEPNADLGLQRARAVAAMLTAGGVGADRIETASGGESDPAATNATAEGRQDNRRTELVVLSR